MTEALLAIFVTLFVTIDPIGLAPMFVALTQGVSKEERRRIALRAALIGFSILALFGLAGEAVLGFIGISLPAFKIAGGLLLFLISVDMLFERRTARREKTVEKAAEEEHLNTDHPADPSVFPLATPLLAGPGSIATMILVSGEFGTDWTGQALVLIVMASVILSAYTLFLLSNVLERVLGQVGITVITRLLGMLLAALSVQFVLNGLHDVGLIPGLSG